MTQNAGNELWINTEWALKHGRRLGGALGTLTIFCMQAVHGGTWPVVPQELIEEAQQRAPKFFRKLIYKRFLRIERGRWVLNTRGAFAMRSRDAEKA